MAKIWVVEDEANIASFIQRGLRECGHEAVVATDGEQGWLLAESGGFDCLLLDDDLLLARLFVAERFTDLSSSRFLITTVESDASAASARACSSSRLGTHRFLSNDASRASMLS